MQALEWKVEDFYGRYHRSRIKNVDPIPGSAIKAENLKEEVVRARTALLEQRVQDIHGRHKTAVKVRGQKMALESTLLVEHICEGVARQVDNSIKAREAEVEVLTSNVMGRLANTRKTRIFLELVASNKCEEVQDLADHGFHAFNSTEPGYCDTALMMACRRGYVSMVGLLLKLGANPNVINKFGETAANLCWRHWPETFENQGDIKDFQESSYNILKELLLYGANPNNAEVNGFTPLHEAARFGPVHAVQILLKYKGDYNVKDFKGRTPYDYAKEGGQLDACRLIDVWESIKNHLEPEEFKRKWMEFMKDPNARISASKGVQEVLEEERLKEHHAREISCQKGNAFGVVDRPTTAALIKNNQEWRERTAAINPQSPPLNLEPPEDLPGLYRSYSRGMSRGDHSVSSSSVCFDFGDDDIPSPVRNSHEQIVSYYDIAEPPMRLAAPDRPLKVPVDHYLLGLAPPHFLEHARTVKTSEVRTDLTYLLKDGSRKALQKPAEMERKFQTSTAQRRHRAARAVAMVGTQQKSNAHAVPGSALYRGSHKIEKSKPVAVIAGSEAVSLQTLYGSRLVSKTADQENLDINLQDFAFFGDEARPNMPLTSNFMGKTWVASPTPLLYNSTTLLPVACSKEPLARPNTIAGSRPRPICLHTSDPESKIIFNPRPRTRQHLECSWRNTDGMYHTDNF